MISLPRRSAIAFISLLLITLTATVKADDVPLAMKGYDPVAYFSVAAPTKGKSEFSHVWDGERYLFSTAENRDRFAKEPARYAPQFPGYCAAALTRGEIVTPDPQNWIIIEGKLYLFGKSIGPELFRKDPSLVETAKANWARIHKSKE
jgi:YHS domain-containing protein